MASSVIFTYTGKQDEMEYNVLILIWAIVIIIVLINVAGLSLNH